MIPAPWLDAAMLITLALLLIFVVTPLAVRWAEWCAGRAIAAPISQDVIDEVQK